MYLWIMFIIHTPLDSFHLNWLQAVRGGKSAEARVPTLPGGELLVGKPTERHTAFSYKMNRYPAATKNHKIDGGYSESGKTNCFPGYDFSRAKAGAKSRGTDFLGGDARHFAARLGLARVEFLTGGVRGADGFRSTRDDCDARWLDADGHGDGDFTGGNHGGGRRQREAYDPDDAGEVDRV